MRIAVVGPTRGGKTVYLAALLRAAFSLKGARTIKVRPDPKNAASLTLDQQAAALICGETLPGTASATRFDLFADLPGSVLFGIGRETLDVQMVDVPGGDAFPAPGTPVAPEIANVVAEADGLLIILPADPAVRVSDVDKRLTHLVRSAGAAVLRRRPYPFQRIAVVLSMAELLVMERGGGALAALDRMDASAMIGELYGTAFMQAVAALVPPGGDWYSLVSAFGFDPATGETTAERHGDGWRLATKGEKFRDDWWPYRLLEPIEFLGRGVCWREAI
jgi:hypothetical protein